MKSESTLFTFLMHIPGLIMFASMFLLGSHHQAALFVSSYSLTIMETCFHHIRKNVIVSCHNYDIKIKIISSHYVEMVKIDIKSIMTWVRIDKTLKFWHKKSLWDKSKKCTEISYDETDIKSRNYDTVLIYVIKNYKLIKFLS